jgi:NAD(P)-dependent dehydrogenase (short-subunit alcohol dehydrogenase family)
VLVEVLDVTDDDRATEIIERYTPWALVNAAGLLSPGFLADTPPSEARLHLDVMVLAPLRLGQLALPSMRASGGGRIVNVSSFLGDERLPMLGWYQAANQALSNISGRPRAELAHDGVGGDIGAGPTSSTSSWCSVRGRAGPGPRQVFPACTWRPRRHIRAAASTVRAAPTRRAALLHAKLG